MAQLQQSFRFFQLITEKLKVDFSGIQTEVDTKDGVHDDH